MRGAQEAPHLRLADHDIAGRQIQQDLGAGRRAERARRLRHPKVLADLDVKNEFVGTASGKQQIDAERRLLSGEGHHCVAHPFARSEMPPFVKLPVIRQKHLRHDAEQSAAMNDDAAIIKPSAPAQRRADDKDRTQFLAGGQQASDLPDHRVEHSILKQQIVDRIGRQAQLGKDHQREPGLVALGEQLQHLIAVLRRLGHRNLRHAGADSHEFMPIGREKRGHRARPSRGAHCRVIYVMTLLSISGHYSRPMLNPPSAPRSRGARQHCTDRHLCSREAHQAASRAPNKRHHTP